MLFHPRVWVPRTESPVLKVILQQAGGRFWAEFQARLSGPFLYLEGEFLSSKVLYNPSGRLQFVCILYVRRFELLRNVRVGLRGACVHRAGNKGTYFGGVT